MRLRYLQSGGNNPEILLHIADVEQNAIAVAHESGHCKARHQKDLGTDFRYLFNMCFAFLEL